MPLSKEEEERIEAIVERVVLRVAPALIQATLASTNRPRRLEADEIGDTLDREEAGKEERAKQRGIAQGLTEGQAAYKAALETGIDPTPDAFDDPSRTYVKKMRVYDPGGNESYEDREVTEKFSYFSPPAGSAEAAKLAGFRAEFEVHIKAGTSTDVAYEKTCEKFGVPVNRRPPKTIGTSHQLEEDERMLLGDGGFKGGIF